MQDTCAAFTMARNEPLWLRVWLSYNSKELGEENCVVIHEPNDETVEEAKSIFTNVVFIEQKSPKPGVQKQGFYDSTLELWRLDVVRNTQTALLRKYKSVIFGDTDELLVPFIDGQPFPLLDYCGSFVDSGCDRVRCTCWQPVQQVETESDIAREPGTKILADRSKMWRLPNYDKTLLVSSAQMYSKGFHLTYGKDGTGQHAGNGLKKRIADVPDPTLMMLHMWRCDFEDWWRDGQWRYPGISRDDAYTYFMTHHHPKIVDAHNPHAEGPETEIPESLKQLIEFR